MPASRHPPVRVAGIGGQRDDGRRGEKRVGANAASGLEAIHHRHLDVHQDTVESTAQHRVERLLAVARADDRRPLVLEQRGDHLLVDQVVLDDEDARTEQARGVEGDQRRRLRAQQREARGRHR